MWAQAIGAVLGPLSLSPAGGGATALTFPVEAGGFLLGVALFGVAAVAGAIAPTGSRALLAGALFALGFGWCLAFVAASALLSRGLAPAARVLQGRVESLTWMSGAGAALSSGLLLGLVGFSGVNLLACGLLAVPLAVIVAHRGVMAQHRVSHP